MVAPRFGFYQTVLGGKVLSGGVYPTFSPHLGHKGDFNVVVATQLAHQGLLERRFVGPDAGNLGAAGRFSRGPIAGGPGTRSCLGARIGAAEETLYRFSFDDMCSVALVRGFALSDAFVSKAKVQKDEAVAEL